MSCFRSKTFTIEKKVRTYHSKDMQVITMRLIDKNKEVERVLEEAVKKAGKPVSICSDLEPDVMSSIRSNNEKISRAYNMLQT